MTNRLEVMRKDSEKCFIIEGAAIKSVFGRFEKATIIQQYPIRKEARYEEKQTVAAVDRRYRLFH